ncbi:Major vault protein [Balamuthia mandrillaris]
MASVIRISPFHYIHVLDNNANVTRVEVGPQTFTRQEHEKVVAGPNQMVIVPPRHYCIIQNPITRSEDGTVAFDSNGNVKLRHGDEEIRFEQDPFPLYPGEVLRGGKVQQLQVVAPNTALRLRAIRDFYGKPQEQEVPEGGSAEEEVKRNAGDEWLWVGPGTYKPRVEVQVTEVLKATLIGTNQALQLKARKACVDKDGNKRAAGEEWIVRTQGAYLNGVDEEIVGTLTATILTPKKALHLRATRTFTDVFGVRRPAGAEWLVTLADAETHIRDVYEEEVGEVHITTLTNRQYCVVLDPIGSDGKQVLGTKELRVGPVSFFLRPGERLESGIQSIYVLTAEEALLLRAKEAFDDEDSKRLPGDRWMIYGPCDYVPPVTVEIVERRRAIPLDENEGIYVRDITSGKVRSVIGESYMLKPNEELWEKDLPKTVEELLNKANNLSSGSVRDKTRVVSLRAPHNTAVQIYDYKEKKARVEFGPELIMLGAEEHFTVLSLSGDKPKRPHVIKDLALQLGPDFMTDIVTVETADHARLSLKLSYNWYFDIGHKDEEAAHMVFQVPDFVGDGCKAIAARVRGAVARRTFDDFHKNSARIIRSAVFGTDENGKIRNTFRFAANNLIITNIDIQSVEPVDQRTRDSLQKSVQLAIEITTNSQEASARHEAQRLEQEAKGKLERQKIQDEAEAEKAKKDLLQLQAQSAAVESTGQATAEAKARAEAAQIEGEAAVTMSKLKAESTKIRTEAELEEQKLRQEAEAEHQAALDELELLKAKELAAIEAKKFKDIVSAIGAETIASIAQAGPEMQAKLLQGLGLKSLMITDGNSPINLFSTAGGLINSGSQ